MDVTLKSDASIPSGLVVGAELSSASTEITKEVIPYPFYKIIFDGNTCKILGPELSKEKKCSSGRRPLNFLKYGLSKIFC